MRIRTRSIIIIFSRGVTQATTLLLTVMLVRLVSMEVFGTYRQAFVVYATLTGVLSLQLGTGLFYFIPKLGAERRRELLEQTILLTFVIAGCVAVILWVGAGWFSQLFANPDLARLVRILALYPFVDHLVALVPSYMISLDRPVRAGVYSVAGAGGQVAIVVGGLWLGYELVDVIWGTVAWGGLLAVIGCTDMWRFAPAGLRVGRWELTLEQWQYSWPLLVTGMLGVLNLQFDKLLISSYFDPATYAVYSCGAIELPVIALITTSVSAAIMPLLVPLAHGDRVGEAVALWQAAARKCSLIVFPCFAYFLLASRDVIVLFYREEYAAARWPFAIYLFMLPLRAVVYSSMFRALGKTRPIALGAALALVVNVVLSSVLIWWGQGTMMSFVGPSIGTVVSVFVMVSYLLRALSKLSNIPVPELMRWRELSTVLLISVVSGVIVWLVPLPPMHLLPKLIAEALIFVAGFSAILWWGGVLDMEEREFCRLPVRFLARVIGR